MSLRAQQIQRRGMERNFQNQCFNGEDILSVLSQGYYLNPFPRASCYSKWCMKFLHLHLLITASSKLSFIRQRFFRIFQWNGRTTILTALSLTIPLPNPFDNSFASLGKGAALDGSFFIRYSGKLGCLDAAPQPPGSQRG